MSAVSYFVSAASCLALMVVCAYRGQIVCAAFWGLAAGVMLFWFIQHRDEG